MLQLQIMSCVQTKALGFSQHKKEDISVLVLVNQYLL